MKHLYLTNDETATLGLMVLFGLIVGVSLGIMNHLRS